MTDNGLLGSVSVRKKEAEANLLILPRRRYLVDLLGLVVATTLDLNSIDDDETVFFEISLAWRRVVAWCCTYNTPLRV